jgi:hypothetical protein
MSEKDESKGEVKEGEIVGGVVFVAHDRFSEVVQAGEEAFDLPAFAIAAQRASIRDTDDAPQHPDVAAPMVSADECP